MDDATRKLIQNCLKVSATPSAVMRLVHLMTGEKYSVKKWRTSWNMIDV
jgi:hypothetical protein